MSVKLSSAGYEMLRERQPIKDCYAEIQMGDGTPVTTRYAIDSYRISVINENPMVFSLPISGDDIDSSIDFPCLIEQAQLFETVDGDDPVSPSDSIEPLLLALPGDKGAIILTINLPKVI